MGSGTFSPTYIYSRQVEPLISPRAKQLVSTLITFLEDDCLPSEQLYHSSISLDPAKRWRIPPVMNRLKARAKELGLWNLWLSGSELKELAGDGPGLSTLEYAVLAEISGYSLHLAPQAMNCSAPDTGNMEVLARFGTPDQKRRYLRPLFDGEIRSSFAMTEYGVASSDATNLHNTTAAIQGDKVRLSGHKWWISGAGDPRNRLHIVLALTHPHASTYKRHSLVLIDPSQPGVKVGRPLTIYGYDDAPEGHCEVVYDDVVADVDCVLGGAEGLGRGFEMIQARLGPGRLHHTMRALGACTRALDLMLLRATERKTFGKRLVEHGTVLSDVAQSRAEVDMARAVVYAAARRVDLVGAKAAAKDVSMAKFVVPRVALGIVDRAVQAHGAEGISQDQPLASLYASLRTLRFADGPDEVHVRQVGRAEVTRVDELRARYARVQDARRRTTAAKL
ncbi:hypothetical protein Q5752_004993 [Cryptotrichosporon argae]